MRHCRVDEVYLARRFVDGGAVGELYFPAHAGVRQHYFSA